MERLLYSEWVSAGKFVKAIVGFVSLLFAIMLVIFVWIAISIQNPYFAVIMVLPLLFVLALFGNYRGIQINITSKELVIRYGLLNRKHIPMSNIVSCEPTKANFGKYLGVGIRYGADGSWAYSTSFGDAVKITQLNGRPFVFSSNNPSEVCSIIRGMKPQAKVE
jgi:hypothetical protein